MARRAALKQVYSSEEVLEFSKPTNRLKLRLDDMKTFQPLTDNQNKFFQAYKQGDYFIALHGVAGTGKTFSALYNTTQFFFAFS